MKLKSSKKLTAIALSIALIFQGLNITPIYAEELSQPETVEQITNSESSPEDTPIESVVQETSDSIDVSNTIDIEEPANEEVDSTPIQENQQVEQPVEVEEELPTNSDDQLTNEVLEETEEEPTTSIQEEQIDTNEDDELETEEINLLAMPIDAVAQINDTKYASLQEAFDAVEDGQTILLLKDSSESIQSKENVSFTFDLQQHAMNHFTNGINIPSNTHISIQSGQFSDSTTYDGAIYGSGSFDLNNVTFNNITSEDRKSVV